MEHQQVKNGLGKGLLWMMDGLKNGLMAVNGPEMRLLHHRNGPVKGLLMTNGIVK